MGVNVKQIGSVQGLSNALVTPSLIAPNSVSGFVTSIVNRASIPNLAADFGVRFGIDRISVQQIYEIPNEFGPNGERVFGAVNDQYGLIRFVGNWININDSNGVAANTQSTGDYVEITFYGTGINLLTQVYLNASTDLRVSVDGGAEGSNIFLSSNSPIFGRNYNTNQAISMASGLSLGIHTVRLRQAGGTYRTYGFEVIGSAAASSSVTVNPGQISVGGMPGPTLASASSFAYNAPVTGTRGGRVIVYSTATGSIAQAWRAVNPSAAFLTNADHTNEEVARVYHPREFGAGRSDDFSRMPSSGANVAAFTLEDGTTTLTASRSRMGVIGGYDMLAVGFQSTANDFVVFTFVGTGLDIMHVEAASNSTPDSFTYSIDGAAAQTLLTTGSTVPVVQKIVSGLPYGTHTLRITRSNTNPLNWDYGIIKFIVYQPKKPTLPAGAVELADYNVMADYVANSVQGNENLGVGVLRKLSTREFVYRGTFLTPTLTVASGATGPVGGWNVNGQTAGNAVEYTFFGTGAEVRFSIPGTTGLNATISVDGSSNLSGYTTSFYGTGVNFTPSTGIVTTGTANTYAAGVSIRNIPLGVHTVRFAYNSGSYFSLEALDIITPVHTHKSNGPMVYQNTLPVGSESIGDLRKLDFQDLRGDQKAVAQATSIQSPTTTSTSYIPMPDMSCAIKTNGGRLKISYSVRSQNTNTGQDNFFQIYVNGAAIGQQKIVGNNSAGVNQNVIASDQIVISVPAGTHKVDVYWRVGAGTATGFERTLLVEES